MNLIPRFRSKTNHMADAINLYLEHIKSVCPDISWDELQQFSSELTVLKLKRKEFLVKSGQIQKRGAFVIHGLLRSFYTNENGWEKNVFFFDEGKYATHLPAFMDRRPSPLSFQSIEPTTLATFPIDHLRNTYQSSPKFEKYGRLIAERRLKRQQIRLESVLYENAEQRYRRFVKTRPKLFQRISVSQLSSYLGVQRQTLTRIRKKILRENQR